MKKILLVLVIFLVITGCSNTSTFNDNNITEERQVLDLDYSYSTVNGIDVFSYTDDKYKTKMEFPKALGFPKYTIEELKQLDKESAIAQLDNFADIYMYIHYVKNVMKNNIEGINIFYEYLKDKYDEVKYLNITDGITNYRILCVLTEGNYYPLDISQYLHSPAKYLNNYAEDNYLCSDLSQLEEKLKVGNPWMNGENVIVTCLEGDNIPKPLSSKHDKDKSWQDKKITLINGEETTVYKYNNTEVYDYCDVQIPLGLGLPKLTLDEINELINSDHTTVAEKITTFADAIAYVVNAEFNYQDNTGWRFGEISMADVGNICYPDDPFIYSASGLELLNLRLGQCTSMSTLFNYLLYGDYPEVGYVKTTEHGMLYVVDNNGIYYLLNPANYIMQNGHLNCTRLYEMSCQGMLVSSEDPQELFEDFIRYFSATFLYTYSYDGVWCMTVKNPGESSFSDPNETQILPEGCKVVCYVGDMNFEYAVPKHSTSQTNIIGLKFD